MHGKRKDRGRKNLYTTTGVKRLCETVHIPRKREGERKEGWDSGERAGAHTHVYAYARQVCATASIWNDRETETWARRSEEERETGRGRREEQQRVVVGCCWRGQRESKTREQGNHMYLTWNLYMAANGWERSRVIVEGGRNVRVATHTHIHIYVHTGHYCQPSLGGHRAPIPSTAIEICRKCAANTRVSLENFFDLLYRPRNLSSNSPVVSNPRIRAFVLLHSFFGKLNFFFGENKKRVCLESKFHPCLIDDIEISRTRFRKHLKFVSAWTETVHSFKKTWARPPS